MLTTTKKGMLGTKELNMYLQQALNPADSFKKENGSYICRDLLDCDIRTEEGIKYAIDNNLFKEICPKMVESAAKIAQELIL